MVFARFQAIYTHKYRSAYNSEEEIRRAKREWALSLGGYSQQQLERGISRAKERLSWPPAIADFLELLQPEPTELGLPDCRAAYIEACRHSHHPLAAHWSHPVVYYAGALSEWFVLASYEEKEAYPRFKKHYRQLCQRLLAGEVFDMPKPQALEDRRNDTLLASINQFAKAHQISLEQAHTLFFYMHKPAGSEVRQRYREVSQARADVLNLEVVLPE